MASRLRLPAPVFATLLVVALTGFVLYPAPEASPRFNHVMLYVSDLEASIDFYTDAFDLELERIDSLTVVGTDGTETTRPVRMAFLRFPGQEFLLELAEQQAVAGEAPGPLYQHLGIDVTDIESSAERAIGAGAQNFSGVRTVRATGGVVAMNAFFQGPDGELLELMQVLEGRF